MKGFPFISAFDLEIKVCFYEPQWIFRTRINPFWTAATECKLPAHLSQETMKTDSHQTD